MDGEVKSPGELVIAIESKIYKNKFDDNNQITRYFNLIKMKNESIRVLLLISPDTERPKIIDEVEHQTEKCRIQWLSWQNIYNWFHEYSEIALGKESIELYLISQFNEYISQLNIINLSSKKKKSSKYNPELKNIFGNDTTEKVLLHIFHFNGTHGRKIAQDYNTDVFNVQRQLEKLNKIGLLYKERLGKTVVFNFNRSSPYFQPIYDLTRIVYDNIPLELKKKIFIGKTEK